MSRKEFFYKASKLALGLWTTVILIRPKFLFSNGKINSQENQMSQKIKFMHNWISNLMKNMDQHMDEKEKIKLLEECGRACARIHAQKEAMKFQGQLEGWLSTMKKWVGSENIRQEEDVVHVMYSKCYCPLVQDAPPLMSNTYCNCSRGWLKEVFDTVMENPVEVKLEDSIMKGGKQCRFSVFL
jgi:predicted hydrocarbon binding protein